MELIKQKDIFEDENEGMFNYKLVGGTKLVKEILNPHTPGVKLDGEKPNLDLVLGDFSRALMEVGKVGTFGAKEYSEHGWLSVPRAYNRYQSALLRHNFSKEDSVYDKDSGLLHDAHRAWNALAALELYLRGIK
jgi:hypothetical protein